MDKRFVLKSSDTAQWQAIVEEAQAHCSYSLHEDLESYLVFLLMRYMEKSDLGNSVIATELFGAHQQVGQMRQDNLRDVGDKCLLFSGLFPGNAEKRLVRISYFVEMGQTAYDTLAREASHDLAELFASLHQEFIQLMEVLQAMRNVSNPSEPLLEPLQAFDLWLETGSDHLWKQFKSSADGFLITPKKITKN